MEITTTEFRKISDEIRIAFLNPKKQKREIIIKPILIDILKKYNDSDNLVKKIFVNVELDKPELLKIWEVVKNEHTGN